MIRPLDDLRVVDLSRVLAGPYCSMILGDMGADVVKIERPDGGDDTRRFGPPFVDGVSTYYLAINRNKRSVALDLKDPDGQAALWRLIEEADVLLENFRPGTLERLGFSYDACIARNPRLVYCSVSAFGHAGDPEWSKKPGYDVMMQGMGGIPSLTGPPDGPPFKVGASIADVTAGMQAVQGILFALLARAQTGRGQHVDCSMLEGQIALLAYLSSAWLNTGQAPPRLGNGHLSVAPYGSYEASDGWFNIAIANDVLWHKFCAAIDAPHIEYDPRFVGNPDRVANTTALDGLLAPIIAARTVEEWITLFDAAGVPSGPVLTVPQVLAHPQVAARDMIVDVPHPTLGTVKLTGTPIRLSDTPGAAVRPPPALGEHTREVLEGLGLDASKIDVMCASGAAFQAD